MPKININIEKCKGCEYCVINCPKKIIRVSDKLNKKGFNYVVASDGCTGCGFCFQMCPENAIEIEVIK